MEDQGKRLLLAAGIAFALMLAWTALFPPEQPPPESVSPAEPAGDRSGGEPPSAAPESAAGAPRRGQEGVYRFEFPRFRAVLSDYGAALIHWQLLGDKYLDTETGQPLDLVKTGDAEELRPLQLGFIDSTYSIPQDAQWRAEDKTDTSIRFVWESEQVRVEKKFDFVPDHYLVKLTVSLAKLAQGEATQRLVVTTFGAQDPSTESSPFAAGEALVWRAACLVGEDLESEEVGELGESELVGRGKVKWAGFNHSYFLAAVAPEDTANAGRLGCQGSVIDAQSGTMKMDVVFPSIRLRDGDPPYTRVVSAYFGPKYLDGLKAAGALIGPNTDLQEAVDLGWFAVIARPLLWLLKTFHSFVGNWGLAIIMLTIVVWLATLPWTTKSMRSMKAMAELRPHMEKIREKYGEDKQRQQIELMNLYKAHKINPLAGCLPMLLQMPIWFALYRSLSVAAELYRSPFIPGWLNDLTAKDPYYITPVLLTGMMFLQTKLQPTTVDSAQQKMMMYGMPIMFGGFSLFFPSGLTLYILTNTVLRTGHQLWLNRSDRREPEGAGEVKAAGASEPASPAARAKSDAVHGAAAGGDAAAGSGAGGRRRTKRKTGARGGRRSKAKG
jgi:YidC/Oxa1 family membrane protein insertase